MTTKSTLIATACLASLSSALHGQTGFSGPANEKTASFQYFRTGDAVAGKMAIRLDGIGQTITGKPFSAIEERQTIQVLGDGTRINKKVKTRTPNSAGIDEMNRRAARTWGRSVSLGKAFVRNVGPACSEV